MTFKKPVMMISMILACTASAHASTASGLERVCQDEIFDVSSHPASISIQGFDIVVPRGKQEAPLFWTQAPDGQVIQCVVRLNEPARSPLRIQRKAVRLNLDSFLSTVPYNVRGEIVARYSENDPSISSIGCRAYEARYGTHGIRFQHLAALNIQLDTAVSIENCNVPRIGLRRRSQQLEEGIAALSAPSRTDAAVSDQSAPASGATDSPSSEETQNPPSALRAI